MFPFYFVFAEKMFRIVSVSLTLLEDNYPTKTCCLATELVFTTQLERPILPKFWHQKFMGSIHFLEKTYLLYYEKHSYGYFPEDDYYSNYEKLLSELLYDFFRIFFLSEWIFLKLYLYFIFNY